MMARDAGADGSIGIGARMAEMLGAAIAEATEGMGPDGLSNVPSFIALPEPRPGLPADLSSLLTVPLTHGLGLATDKIQFAPGGHAAGLTGLQWAAQKIASGQMDICVVAGVDSYHDRESLDWLDRSGALMSASNRNGFPPGEGAGACVLAHRSTAQQRGLAVTAVIKAAATAVEPHPAGSGRVCIGEGLTAAMNGVIGSLRLPEQMITSTYCDLNGERYRNEELVYALLRTQEAFIDAHDYRSPADCWGDVGAASGPLFACLAVAAQTRGYAPGPYPLLWAGSARGSRAAVLLMAAEARAARGT